MATYHLSIKSGKRGKAKAHAAYIAREGKYGSNNKGHDLIATEYGNLPHWANDNPSLFWKTADQKERVNGAAYREFEVALPAELSTNENINVVKELVQQEIGEKPYQFAIHSPKAALKNVDQPHVHIMFSDRKPDGIERSPEQHFKRYNPNDPTLGGCKKESGGKDRITLKSEIKALRENVAALLNRSLEKHGHPARVDSRSHRDRGIERPPERHLGYAGIKLMGKKEKNLLIKKRVAR